MDSNDPKNRVKKPGYRNEISQHGVQVDRFGLTMPGEVKTFAKGVLDRARSSPPPSTDELDSIRKQLAGADDRDEDIVRKRMAKACMFPSGDEYGERIVEGANLPFTNEGLPFIASAGPMTKLITPKTDLTFGYKSEADVNVFTRGEYKVMQHARLKPYAHATSAGCWPFFLIEYKATSRNGDFWTAENQLAASGSHSVKSLDTLYNYCDETRKRKVTDTVAFSCVAFGHVATIWVHWRQEEDDKHFVSSQIKMYDFVEHDDIVAFRASTRNIIDHGLGDRLTNIKSALQELNAKLADWDRQDKAAKVHKLERSDTATTVKSKVSKKNPK